MIPVFRPLPLALLACLAVSAVGHAKSDPKSQIVISHGWFTTLPHNGPTYGYFEIVNSGGSARMMTSYSSPACQSVRLEEAHGGGINAKAPVQVTVAPKTTMAFVRDGYHLVCDSPTGKIKVGSTVPVTVRFLDGQSMQAAFQVRTYPYQ